MKQGEKLFIKVDFEQGKWEISLATEERYLTLSGSAGVLNNAAINFLTEISGDTGTTFEATNIVPHVRSKGGIILP